MNINNVTIKYFQIDTNISEQPSAADSSKRSVPPHRTTRHIPESRSANIHRRKNFDSHNLTGQQTLCCFFVTSVFLDLIWELLGAKFPPKLTDLFHAVLSFCASREKFEKLEKVLQQPQINHIILYHDPRLDHKREKFDFHVIISTHWIWWWREPKNIWKKIIRSKLRQNFCRETDVVASF
jgi:hypothetical protein